MSDLNLTCFLNADRPQLQDPSVANVPGDALGPELAATLQASFAVGAADQIRCAASARLWEGLLERYRVPFLLLRVADMRYVLGSRLTALYLYEELEGFLDDPSFSAWVLRLRDRVDKETTKQCKSSLQSEWYNNTFTPSQRWRTQLSRDSFPYCKLQRAQLTSLRNKWEALGDDVMFSYLNYHCLETNALEEVVKFCTPAARRLVHGGFDEATTRVIMSAHIVDGAVRHRDDAILVLRDVRKAFEEVIELAKCQTVHLTVEFLCQLHETLMRSSRVMLTQTGDHRRLSYVNIGVTRQTSRLNVVVRNTQSKIPMTVQFCPYDDVDDELAVFCERFNDLMQQPNVDPFAAAAWTSHVFVTIHPFQDGNGRMSRMLASIPLLRNQLPPLCVSSSDRISYLATLNLTRANRDGDYSDLMRGLYNATLSSLNTLGSLLTKPPSS